MISRRAGNLVEAVILAAGKGTRMKSDLPKVLHSLAGRPLLTHVLSSVRRSRIVQSIVVVGHHAARVKEACAGPDLEFIVQEPQLGTGHALQVAAPHLDREGITVVLNGDVPLLRPETIDRLIALTEQENTAATVLTCVVNDAGSYGRIVKNHDGRLLRIVEARDASEAELACGEFNTGVYCFRTAPLLSALEELTADNDQNEYYLTDTIAHLVAARQCVAALVCDDQYEVVGINTMDELAAAERLYLARGA